MLRIITFSFLYIWIVTFLDSSLLILFFLAFLITSLVSQWYSFYLLNKIIQLLIPMICYRTFPWLFKVFPKLCPSFLMCFITFYILWRTVTLGFHFISHFMSILSGSHVHHSWISALLGWSMLSSDCYRKLHCMPALRDGPSLSFRERLLGAPGVCSGELVSRRNPPGGCQSSRISGSLWLETGSLFAVWLGMPSLGLSLPLSPPPCLLPPAVDGLAAG